jgi:hypothetical protein
MQRAHIGKLVSVGGVVALVTGILILDPRLRQQAAGIGEGKVPSDLVAVQSQVEKYVYMAVEMAKDQSVENAPLVMFTVAAALLVFFMLRT